MGSCHRTKTRSPGHNPRKDLRPYPERTKGFRRIRERTPGERIHQTVQKPVCFALLLHQKERWKAETGPRLSKSERMDDQKPIPPPIDSRTDRASKRGLPIHKVRRPMGVQQRADQRRRSMESRLRDKPRTVRTQCNVLWPHKLPRHLPDNDEFDLLRGG